MTLQEDAQMLLVSLMHLRASGTREVPEYLVPDLPVMVFEDGYVAHVEPVQERFEILLAGALRALDAVASEIRRQCPGVDVDELLRAALNHLVELDERAT